AYRFVSGARSSLYDHGLRAERQPPVPALSVGNLSVGGTGKTPVAAWMAARLRSAGGSPAIVMRGYGDDEPLVHARLNPDIPVHIAPDRLAGTADAVAGGADCVVLDDAFQHRRVARVVDAVLVSAEQWSGHVRLLPAGPWREPVGALARATLVLVTRKSADLSRAIAVAEALAAHTAAPIAVVSLILGALVGEEGSMPLESIRGRKLLAVAGIGDPTSFRRQLEAAGATVRTAFFGDHHRYSPADVAMMASTARADELTVCTLKDYVKLARHWPRVSPFLWYVSQRVAPESGESAITSALDSVLRARHSDLYRPASPV
ncbi:MAG: tetraacyldisaccharide 4'-kinase, partial [Gemmatimonadaceae bacterium]